MLLISSSMGIILTILASMCILSEETCKKSKWLIVGTLVFLLACIWWGIVAICFIHPFSITWN